MPYWGSQAQISNWKDFAHLLRVFFTPLRSAPGSGLRRRAQPVVPWALSRTVEALHIAAADQRVIDVVARAHGLSIVGDDHDPWLRLDDPFEFHLKVPPAVRVGCGLGRIRYVVWAASACLLSDGTFVQGRGPMVLTAEIFWLMSKILSTFGNCQK